MLLGSFLYRIAKGMASKEDRKSTNILTPFFNAVSIFAYRIGAIRGYKTVYSKEKSLRYACGADVKEKEEAHF
jgi:hypothetical protein